MNRWKEFYSLTRRDGITKSSWLTLKFILRKTLGLHWQRNLILRRPLEKPIQEVTPKIEVKIRQAHEEDLILFKGVVDEETYVTLPQRFRDGHICFIALHVNSITSYSWLSFPGQYNASLRIKLSDKEDAYFYDVLVLPEYRNNKLQAALLTATMKCARSLGYTYTVTSVNELNTFSIRALKRAGFEAIGFVRYIEMFGRKYRRFHKYS